MGDEYGSDFISVTDEDGNEFELEHLDTLELNQNTYMAFLPADFGKSESPETDASEGEGLIILKTITENGEEFLSTLDSEDELEAVYELFMKRLFDDDEPDLPSE
jgi:uncharacterized protein YrzB (UPF0473 family)